MSESLIAPTGAASSPAHELSPLVTPAQVWSALSSERQRGAVWLLVQLACNQLTVPVAPAAGLAQEPASTPESPASGGVAPGAVPTAEVAAAPVAPAAPGGY